MGRVSLCRSTVKHLQITYSATRLQRFKLHEEHQKTRLNDAKGVCVNVKLHSELFFVFFSPAVELKASAFLKLSHG